MLDTSTRSPRSPTPPRLHWPGSIDRLANGKLHSFEPPMGDSVYHDKIILSISDHYNIVYCVYVSDAISDDTPRVLKYDFDWC